MENEGVVLLLESRLFILGDACLYMVPAGAGVNQVILYIVDNYQEFRYTVSLVLGVVGECGCVGACVRGLTRGW